MNVEEKRAPRLKWRAVVIVLAICLAASLAWNIHGVRQDRYRREGVVNNIYGYVRDAAMHIDGFLADPAWESGLEQAAASLNRLDTFIRANHSAVNHADTWALGKIAQTLSYNHHSTLNGVEIYAVLYDRRVSPEETAYLETLRDDLRGLERRLENPDGPGENTALGYRALNAALAEFFREKEWGRAEIYQRYLRGG